MALLQQPPHHIAKKLRKSLLITIMSGLATLGILALIITIASRQIESDLAQSEEAALTDVGTVFRDKDIFALPDNTSYIPDRLDKNTLISVVAKNQPAVVRILSVFCADVTLTSGSSSFSEKDACSAGVGSGSIISKDGYVATNGHVVDTSAKQALVSSLATTEETQRYLTYLVDTKLLARDKADAILAGIDKGLASATDALDETIALIPSSSVTSQHSNVHYAIQLSNEPVRIDTKNNRINVNFTDTVVEAKLIDKDFDQDASEQSLQTGEFTTSDVALLKIGKGSYPYVQLGDSSSVTLGSQLTAIGFPAFIDGSVNTDQWQTVPSITQGNVADITQDAVSNGRKIISTTVPIAQGESGGPSFNNNGEQIGLNTYTVLKCPDLKCFGNGTVRDIADLKALLTKNHITLTKGGVTDEWNKGLDAYVNGNYSEALTAFKAVQDQYPANYLASPFARLAREQSGSSTDTSSSYQTRTVTTALLVILMGIISVVIVSTVILIVHFTRKHHRSLEGQDPQNPLSTTL